MQFKRLLYHVSVKHKPTDTSTSLTQKLVISTTLFFSTEI